ncbi:MAG: gliding motility-associated C-terminal domain-containing protein [Bacteroidota bacterium]|nr:gliding motility-associated C-terminal domain-containing protein [Bacteroidota bacterium]
MKNILYFLIVFLFSTIHGFSQPLLFIDTKDSSKALEIETQATSEGGWYTVSTTIDSAVLVNRFEYCGNLRWTKQFKVDSQFFSQVHFIVFNESALISCVTSGKNKGIFCLSVDTLGAASLPKIISFDGVTDYRRPTLAAFSNDRMLAVNISANNTDYEVALVHTDQNFSTRWIKKIDSLDFVQEIIHFADDRYLLALMSGTILQFNTAGTVNYAYKIRSTQGVRSILRDNNGFVCSAVSIDTLGQISTQLFKFDFFSNYLGNSEGIQILRQKEFDKIVFRNDFYSLIHSNTAPSALNNNIGISVFDRGLTYITTKILSFSDPKDVGIQYSFCGQNMEKNYIVAAIVPDSQKYVIAKTDRFLTFSCNDTFESKIKFDRFVTKFDTLKRILIDISIQSIVSSIQPKDSTFTLKRLCEKYTLMEGAAPVMGCRDSLIIIGPNLGSPPAMSPYLKIKINGQDSNSVMRRIPFEQVTIDIDYCGRNTKQQVKGDEINCCPQVDFPNAVMPGSDITENRVFLAYVPVKGDVVNFTLAIFNRWGQKVFETNNITEAWDTNFKGVPAPMDTYLYYMELLDRYGEVCKSKGSFTIIR